MLISIMLAIQTQLSLELLQQNITKILWERCQKWMSEHPGSQKNGAKPRLLVYT